MKRVIALGALLASGTLLLAAPGSGAATTGCPPGTTNPAYCTPGVTLQKHTARATSGGSTEAQIGCAATGPACNGALRLMLGGSTVGSSNFSIKPGKSAKVVVRLSASARKKLACTGKITVSVASVTGGKRTSLGRLTIKGKKTQCKRVTHVHEHPGFTG